MKIPPNKVGADHTLNLIVIKVADIGEYRQKKPRECGVSINLSFINRRLCVSLWIGYNLSNCAHYDADC